MSVRILFAMGRDNNLPGGDRLASVSGTRRVPVFPAVLVGAIAIAILALNIANPYAVTIVLGLGIIYMYMAYLGVTIPLLPAAAARAGRRTCPTSEPGPVQARGVGDADERHRHRSTARRW